MKMFKNLSLIAVVVLFSTTACNDDFLEKTPLDSGSVEGFFETEEDVSGEGYGDEIPSPPSPPPSSQPEEVESEQEDSNKGFFDEKQAPNKTALSSKI